MPRDFSTTDAARITGASPRRLDHWARTHLLQPSGQQADGKGTRRRYTFQDLISIRTIVDLRNGQCPLQKVRAAVVKLRRLFPELTNTQALSQLTLLTDGKSVYVVTDAQKAMDVLTRQTVWAVPLGRHIAETAEQVASLPQAWTEIHVVHGRQVHIELSQAKDSSLFAANCLELPGVLEKASSANAALKKAKKAIAAVLSHMQRRRPRSSSVSSIRAANGLG